ncbi:hypothetical protein GCM10008941_05830 [Rhizomicrobium palustre]
MPQGFALFEDAQQHLFLPCRRVVQIGRLEIHPAPPRIRKLAVTACHRGRSQGKAAREIAAERADLRQLHQYTYFIGARRLKGDFAPHSAISTNTDVA